MKLSKDKKGFTLIEIVIVIVIIAILAAMLVPSLLKWVDKASDTRLVSAAKTVKECVTAQLAGMYNSGETLGSTETAYDTEFWTNVSEAAGTTVSNSGDDGLVRFDFNNGSVEHFSYTKDGRTAYTNEHGAFVVVDQADYVRP